MTKMRIFAILALGGLMALYASGQTGQAGDTSVYQPAQVGQNATTAADAGAANQADEMSDGIPDAVLVSGPGAVNDEMIGYAAVTIVEPYEGYGQLTLDELSAALCMPAGPQPWDLGEFARWQEPSAQNAYGEPITIIDEGQAIAGLIDLPAEGEGQGQLAADQPQALPAESAAPSVAPQPVVPTVPSATYAQVSPYVVPGTVYATTADYYCQPPMYAPVYYSYYYAYPYSYASSVPLWWNPHWPLISDYGIYPQWPYEYATYFGYPYSGYYSYPYYSMYMGYYDPFLYHPYGGYFGSFITFSDFDFFGHFRHHRFFFRGDWDHDRDDFVRHSGRGFFSHGAASFGRSSFAVGAAVRPWRPSVSHQIAAVNNARNFSLSTGRSRLAQHGPMDLNRRMLSTSAGPGSLRATATPRPGRALTTGGMSGAAAQAIGPAGKTPGTSPRAMTGATAQVRLQQRRDAYMDVLRGRSIGSGGVAADRPSSGGVSRRASVPSVDAAVTAHQEQMRDSLLRRLNAMPSGAGAAPATAGPTRQHGTFQPQVAPLRPVLPGGSAPAGPRSLTPRSLAPRSLTPRTVSEPTATPSVTITPTPQTTSTVPPPEMRFSRSTWPHNSTATPDTTTPRTVAPRTFAPSQAAPSATPPPSYTPRTFTPQTFTPRTVAPGEAAPSYSRSAPSYGRFSPRESSGPTMSAQPMRSYSPAPSQTPSASRSSEYSSPRSRLTDSARDTAGPSRRR